MKQLYILSIAFCIVLQGYAQTVRKQNAFDKWRQEIHGEFDDFRSQIISDYVDFVKNPWKEFKEEKPIVKPKEDDVPPVIKHKGEDKKLDDKPVVIKEIVIPAPVVPQPEPVVPIQDDDNGLFMADGVNFIFYGTSASVRFDTNDKIKLQEATEGMVAQTIKRMCSGSYLFMLADCLALRKKHSLCDWAYLQMLQSLADCVYGKYTNESTLLTACLFMQSGYKMRLGRKNNQLYLLYASAHDVYNKPYYRLDGNNYYGLYDLPDGLQICQAQFKNEQTLSLLIPSSPKLSLSMSEQRVIKSGRNPEMEIKTSINKNLLDFYSSYPSSKLGENFCTQWAMYANAPMPEEVRSSLLPQLEKHIASKPQLEAANMLLHWVQTGFVYEYDDKVWGHDRAFFPSESLYYPYCDCEDRSILLSRLYRDLLNLNCLLVYYPGHLACAVEITEGNPLGDYILYNDRRYYIADGTITGYGAPIGETMTGMDNSLAVVISLQ